MPALSIVARPLWSAASERVSRKRSVPLGMAARRRAASLSIARLMFAAALPICTEMARVGPQDWTVIPVLARKPAGRIQASLFGPRLVSNANFVPSPTRFAASFRRCCPRTATFVWPPVRTRGS